MSILAIKRNSNSVEFLNFSPISSASPTTRGTNLPSTTILETDNNEYSQTSKNKSSILYDFNWFTEKDIVFVTDQSVEAYIVQPEKRVLRLTKQLPLSAARWQLFSREMSLLLISAGSEHGNALYPFSFSRANQQQITKFPKFTVDLPQVLNQRSSSVSSASAVASTTRRSV